MAKDVSRRTAIGWRIPVELKARIVSLVGGLKDAPDVEDVVSIWLEERLLEEERKKIAVFGKPIKR